MQLLTADMAAKNQEIATKVRTEGREAAAPFCSIMLHAFMQEADLRAAREELAVREATHDAAERHTEECAAKVGTLEVGKRKDGERHAVQRTDLYAPCTGVRQFRDNEGRGAGGGV